VEPPAWWTVKSGADVVVEDAHLSPVHGSYKTVHEGTVAGARVVVKRPYHELFAADDADGAAGPDERSTKKREKRGGDRALYAFDDEFGEFYSELLYLEFLRGQPGVPELLGCWRDPDPPRQWAMVVAHGGDAIGGAPTSSRGAEYYSPVEYYLAAKRRPLELARSWLRVGRTLERGGYVMTDLKVDQFTLRDGEILLIDAPDPHGGVVGAFMDENHPAFREQFFPMDGRTCAFDGDCPTTKAFHCCCKQRLGRRLHAGKGDAPPPVICETNRGAPEAQGRCGADGKCAPLSSKLAVFDWANRNWILDHVIARAPEPEAALLRRLKARMSAPDPDDRPTFPELLAMLDRGAAALGRW
jgi:hypothetical protein